MLNINKTAEMLNAAKDGAPKGALPSDKKYFSQIHIGLSWAEDNNLDVLTNLQGRFPALVLGLTQALRLIADGLPSLERGTFADMIGSAVVDTKAWAAMQLTAQQTLRERRSSNADNSV